MKHYKIVKRGTILTIALATLAVFLQLGLTIYTLNSPQTLKEAKAADTLTDPLNFCNSNNPAEAIVAYVGPTLQVNVITMLPSTTYAFTAILYNNSDNSIIGEESNPGVAVNLFPPLMTFAIPASAQHSSLTLTIAYTYKANAGAQNCPVISMKSIPPYADYASSGVSTTFRVDPTSIDLQDASGKPIASPTPIKTTYKFTYDQSKSTNYSYSLTATNCEGGESQKRGGVLSDQEQTYDWVPSERCGSHPATISLTVTDSSLNNMIVNSASQQVSVNDGAGTGINDPNIGKAPIGGIKFEDRVYSLAGFDVKLASIGTGLGPVVDLIENVLLYLVGLLALVGIVYGGILYITAGGDDTRAEKGKKTLLYSVFGIILAVLSVSIVAIIVKFPNIV